MSKTTRIDLINPNFVKQAKFQYKINDGTTQCLNCERKCKISLGSIGHCQTRLNHEGTIYSIVFGCNAGISNNPIEKKPFYHFFPGSRALTIGSFGCNFNCFWCQNHHMSHPEISVLNIMRNYQKFISPEMFVKLALNEGCQGTSISFNEPTLLFEYSLEVFKLAKDYGLYNTYVSNGYMTESVLKDLVDAGLDAINFDIKGDKNMVRKYCGIDVEKVWRNALLAKKLGVHIEITTLLINELNTSDIIIKDISKKIYNYLGANTPVHFSRFFPHYKSLDYGFFEPTPLHYLTHAYKVAKNEGLMYVYLGNVPNSEYINTTCPKCSRVIIERSNYEISRVKLDSNGNCKYCGKFICLL
jgi:pyruvate formate lyase activating enzyme